MKDFNYGQLDPGIREVVRKLHQAGIETTDSGDGVSKPPAGCVIPFPHVVGFSTVEGMLVDAERMAAVLGDGWTVEATYATHDRRVILFARPLDPREAQA